MAPQPTRRKFLYTATTAGTVFGLGDWAGGEMIMCAQKNPGPLHANTAWVSAEWRPHMLAAASYSFIGADALDTDVANQAREAMRKLKPTKRIAVA